MSKCEVIALHIVFPNGETCATMYRDDGVWSDPHGGTFTDTDLQSLQKFAVGMGVGRVTLHAGTKFERTFDARLTASFI